MTLFSKILVLLTDTDQHGHTLRPKSLSDLKMDSKWTPDGPKITAQHTPNGLQLNSQIDFKWTIHRLSNRLQMNNSSTPKSTSKALSDLFPDLAMHELSGRLGS